MDFFDAYWSDDGGFIATGVSYEVEDGGVFFVREHSEGRRGFSWGSKENLLGGSRSHPIHLQRSGWIRFLFCKSALFAHRGEDDNPECEGQREEGNLQERRKAVEDGDYGDPDSPGGDEGWNDGLAVVAGGEEKVDSTKRKAGIFPVVGPRVDRGGEAGVEDELVDEDLDGNYLEGDLGAEPFCLLTIEEVDESTGPGPVEGGEEKVAEVGTCDFASLENDDLHELGNDSSGDDGRDDGVAIPPTRFEVGELVEELGGGRIEVISQQEQEHDGLKNQSGDEISLGGTEPGSPRSFLSLVDHEFRHVGNLGGSGDAGNAISPGGAFRLLAKKSLGD